MSLPRYPAYKNSGVPWLGLVPEHWACVRYKQVFSERVELSLTGEETLLSVSAYTGVSPRSELVAEGDHLTRAESLAGYKVCYPGDLVVNIMPAWNRGLGFSHHHGIVSPAYCVFRLRAENHPGYLNYMVRSDRVTLYFKAHSSGVVESRLRLYPDMFGSLSCVVPPFPEQVAIASFLDRETAKIDALIAEQERLVALLTEKKQATVSNAVTKGLDPKGPVRDSGVAWLGEIPAHWDVMPFRYCANYQEGPGIMASDFQEEGVPLLRLAGVQGRWASLDGCNYLDPRKVESRWGHFRLEDGDLLISASASMGTVCEVRNEAVGSIAYTGIIRVRGIPQKMDDSFLRHLVVSRPFSTQIDLLKAGATIQHFGPTHLSQVVVVRPPLDEQRQIFEYIDKELARLDALHAECESAIRLLAERRNALIGAAVTGQIRVCDVVEKSSGVAEAVA